MGHNNPAFKVALAYGHAYVHKLEGGILRVGQQLPQQVGPAHVAHKQAVFALAKNGADRKVCALQHPVCGGHDLAIGVHEPDPGKGGHCVLQSVDCR